MTEERTLHSRIHSAVVVVAVVVGDAAEERRCGAAAGVPPWKREWPSGVPSMRRIRERVAKVEVGLRQEEEAGSLRQGRKRCTATHQTSCPHSHKDDNEQTHSYLNWHK